MKKWKIMVLALFSAFCIASCGKQTVDVTCIAVQEDGKIDYTIVENFGAEYDVDAFKSMLQSDVDFYNQAMTDGEIEIKEIELRETGKIAVSMSFPTASDFAGFMNINTVEENVFFFGTIEDAYAENYSLDIVVHGREDDKQILKKQDILNLGKNHILIYDARLNHDGMTQEPSTIQITFDEEIELISNGVTVLDKNTVEISAIDGLYYIVL